jgi:hypothetical protein
MGKRVEVKTEMTAAMVYERYRKSSAYYIASDTLRMSEVPSDACKSGRRLTDQRSSRRAEARYGLEESISALSSLPGAVPA